MNATNLLLAAALAGSLWAPTMTTAESTIESPRASAASGLLGLATPSQLPIEGKVASLSGAIGWLNSPPLTVAELRGKVIVVDFWTYSCINWMRTAPYLRVWADKYRSQGLVVIGVHTPEFEFEKDADNVRRFVMDMGINYPVAIDSSHAIWGAFGNQYWPALYVVDAKGQIRHHRFGEGEYEQAERVIQQLLAEAGAKDIGAAVTPVAGQGIEAAPDWRNLATSETYVGYARAENFASPGRASFDKPHEYAIPARLRLNQWALAGDWTVGKEFAVSNKADGRIAFQFHARDLHLVMAPAAQGSPVRFRVLIDGMPPGAEHGVDVDDQGNGTIAQPRLYQLIRQGSHVVDRQFEIQFLDPGAAAYSFTFG